MSKRERYKTSSAVFVILLRDEQICMLQRQNTGWKDGWFSIPAGGLEQGETLVAAAIREAGEEIGIEIEPQDLQLKHTLHCLTDGNSWLGHFFVTRLWQGEPVLREPDKHGNLQWRSIDDLPQQTIDYVRQALLAIHKDEAYSEHGW